MEKNLTETDFDKLWNSALQEVRDEFGQIIQDELKEASLAGELTLAQDSVGWNPIGGSGTYGSEFTEEKRIALSAKSRWLFNFNPFAKQSFRHWTNFSVGTGFMFTSPDKPTLKRIDEIVFHPSNHHIFSLEGQIKTSDNLLNDGEVFFPVFPDAKPVPQIRRIKSCEITHVITDPDDAGTVIGYRHAYTTKSSDGNSVKRVRYYPDWTQVGASRGVDTSKLAAVIKGFSSLDGDASKDAAIVTDAYIYPLRINLIDKRGVGLLSAAIWWMQSMTKFMISRTSIQQAIARFVQKLNMKGGADAVARAKARMQSGLVGQGGQGNETNPATAYGGMFIGNDNAELQNMKMETGASAAQTDGNMLAQIIGSSVGIFPHYFGLGESFRLATATAMELPMRIMFKVYQSLQAEAYVGILTSVIYRTFKQKSISKIQITAKSPDISIRNLGSLFTSLAQLAAVSPEFFELTDVREKIGRELGVDDIPTFLEMWDELFKQRLERDEKKAEKDAAAKAKAPAPGAPRSDDGGSTGARNDNPDPQRDQREGGQD
jgi:hypothetical protein